MFIKKKRIGNIKKYLKGLQYGQEIVIAVCDTSKYQELFEKIGFTKQLEPGEAILPAPNFGPISRYNSEGKQIVHKDRPKETHYRLIQWSWTEWHGRYTEERSDIREVPYERYPRTNIAPPAVELRVAIKNDAKFIISPVTLYTEGTSEQVLHIINLYLEIFGECEILTKELENYLNVPIRRVNWTILPAGIWPWEKAKPHLCKVIELAPEGSRPVIEDRYKKVTSKSPEFMAVGRGGFSGYVVFGFPGKNRFILESSETNNATYVFDQDWEALSEMTKAQILDQNLHFARLIHRKGWHNELDKVVA